LDSSVCRIEEEEDIDLNQKIRDNSKHRNRARLPENPEVTVLATQTQTTKID